MTKKQRKTKKQIILNNKRLLKQYPFLRPISIWTGKPIEITKRNLAQEFLVYDELPYGWLHIAQKLLKELKPILVKGNYLHKFVIIQWKEKYGEMCLYHNGLPVDIYDEVSELLCKYTDISSTTCIKCGHKGKMRNMHGWYEPLCEKCNSEFNS